MRLVILTAAFLFPFALAKAQFNPRDTVLPKSGPNEADSPSPVAPPADPKTIAADPVDPTKDQFVGDKPPLHKTFIYPPGDGQYKFLAAGLELDQDGYYRASAGNGFFMWFPPSAPEIPLSLTCSVKGPPTGFRFGTLSWGRTAGGVGGYVGVRFNAGEGEATYQTNFANGGDSLVMMMLEVPPDSGLKECRVTGAFQIP